MDGRDIRGYLRFSFLTKNTLICRLEEFGIEPRTGRHVLPPEPLCIFMHSSCACFTSYSAVTISLFQEFVSTVERLFPYVTLALIEQNWPALIPAAVTGLSQRVALHVNTASLPKGQGALDSLMEIMDRYDLLVEVDTESSASAFFKALMTQQTRKTNKNLYVISPN